MKCFLALLLVSGTAVAGLPNFPSIPGIGSGAADGKIVFDVAINNTSLQAMANAGEVYRKIGDCAEIFVAFKHSNVINNPFPNLTILTEDRYAAGFLYKFSPTFSVKIGYINLRINGQTFGASGVELIHRF